ncbi:MAG: flagellar basal-body rod protein FlgG, partial [Burkholderiales bacterium]
MIRSLWISKTGLDSQQLNLDVIANNLANVSTNGFKRSRPVFEDLLYQTLRQPGAQSSEQTKIPSGLQLGTGVRAVATVRNFLQGNLTQTGNSLDIAIQGNGFFQILLPDGTTAFTRDGSFQLNADGEIVTASGFTLEPSITIPPDSLSITVAADGAVSVLLPGNATPVQAGSFQLANFINPAGLQARGENLFLETASSGT